MATPQTLASDLLEKINHIILNRRSSVSEFELRSMQNDAKKCLKTDAVSGYMALGALAAMTWDERELKTNHNIAIRLSDNQLTRHNYSASLANVLLYDDAFREICIASRKIPEDIGMLRKAISYGINSGHISEAMKMYSDLIDRSPMTDETYSNPENILKVFEYSQVDEAELIKSQNIVFDTLRKHQMMPLTISRQVDLDPDDPSVIYSFKIDTNSQDAQLIHDEANFRLCEELPDGGHSDVLMFRIVGNC